MITLSGCEVTLIIKLYLHKAARHKKVTYLSRVFLALRRDISCVIELQYESALL
ncbi:hypothetical protein ES703_20366 [subsurface metagenome]